MDTYSRSRWSVFRSVICGIILCTCVKLCDSETRIFTAGQWDGTGVENEYYYASDRNSILETPKYLVLASNTVRPGQVYRVCVSILESSTPLVVRASLHRDGEQVVGATEMADPHQVTTLLMQVPFNAIPGAYRLKIEGHREGNLGGSEFTNETLVGFSERFLTILIQTNQLVYNMEQMMYIRIVLLTTELKPFTEPIDIYIVDSRGVTMKRWVSVYPLLGIVNLEFELPYDYPEGWWTIKVVALGQTEETRVLMERWFSHRFDVNVGTDAFILNTDEFLEGQILANYTSVATVTGNLTLKTFLRPLGKYKDLSTDLKDRYIEEYVDIFHGTYDFGIPLSELRNMASPVPLEHCEIEVQATVGERFYDFTVFAYGRIRVVNSTITLRFLGTNPQVFKPGMPFKTHIAVSYSDLVSLPEEKLMSSNVIINPVAYTANGRRDLEQQVLPFHIDGVVSLIIDPPKNAEKIVIRAYYEDMHDPEARSRAELTILTMYSRQDRYLQVSTSTKKAQAGEYAVFHVWTNFHLKFFNYLVIAKGIIVQSGTEKVSGMIHSITTFSVPVSPEMAPVFHMVVYHITNDGEVFTDSVVLPVDAINKRKFSQKFNTPYWEKPFKIFEQEDQEEYVNTISPKGPSAYALNAIGMNKIYGLHILPEYIIFDSTKPFFILVEGPEEAALGEQIGLRVTVINYQFIEIKAEIILVASDDYRFVEVGPLGIVSSYNPKTSGGEHQHLIYVKPVSHMIVHVPIVATRIGEIVVNIIGRTQVARDIATMNIQINPDGVPVNLHTSMLLDMRNEAYLIRYLDLNVTEDPIIPYQEIYRHYIFGSPKASVSVIGDVVGAPFPIDPKSPVGLRALRVADMVKSGEHIMFDFAYTLYTLHYLRLTNQLRTDTMRGMIEYLNKAYVYQSVFYKNGAYTMFKGEEPSLWLTAYCARMFHLAMYPDWENYLFIDPEMITRSMEYILRYQTREGSFYEISNKPWNRKLDIMGDRRTAFQNISLTAHVLITLTSVSDLSGDIRIEISNAKNLAVKYLERRLPQLQDPYQVALVTYALLEAGSVDAEVGFNKLDVMKREKEGMVYWSPEPISSAETLYQNQRPFTLPRLPNKYDSVAVEATAYALLVYVRYNGVIIDQIVKWLNSMRTTDQGFMASQDTLIATQALIEYSFRTHVRDITNMKVTVESSSNPGTIHSMALTSDNLAEARQVPIGPNVWGHAEVVAKGAGLSILQLDVQYNVDKEFLLIQPPVPSFDLNVRGYFHGRNKSHMNIKSCARWTYTDESPTSGVAVVEITLPTGYYMHKPDMDKYIYSRQVPRLQRGRVHPKSAVFMFDYLDTSWSCVNVTVQRWFPVANITRFLKARVYDYYIPERYKEIIYEDFDLYVLNICEVCGSYQCPYCPYFSFACRLNAQWILPLFAMLIGRLLLRRIS
ncbi:CD109 antigen like protein [Argiope bruennichi]|uniref:CD109 antigen like protein n=1 Tax=Argiope bruennichi TaxID=94029 RepID=A0A8T0ELV5_ARGBR|nr:CD109 antigen like protein [Argiope bruennichi]